MDVGGTGEGRGVGSDAGPGADPGIGQDGGGMGGFGGLGIGNPGSYGGPESVGAPGFGGGYGGGFGSSQGGYGNIGQPSSAQAAAELAAMEKALGIDPGSFSVGYSMAASQGLLSSLAQATSPQNVAGSLTAGMLGALGGKFGATLGTALGASMFGPYGALAAGFIGSKYGKQAAQSLGAQVQAGIRDGTIGSVGDVEAVAAELGIDPGDAVKGLEEGFLTGYNQLKEGGTMATPAQTQASYQQQALDYLKQREQLPWQVGDASMKQLAGLYGLPGFDEFDQAQFMEGVRQDPYYTAVMGTKDRGEDAILRHAGMTGGLRSGNVQSALYDHATLLERDALTGAFDRRVGGLAGLAGTPSYATDIANTMNRIGETRAAGQLAQDQMDQAELGQWIGLGIEGYKALGGYEGIIDLGEEVLSWLPF